MFSASLGYVPAQWKQAAIHPIPKIAQATEPLHFRPISLTCILSRLFERMYTRYFYYPLLRQPVAASLLLDQFAFKPTGSTTAALINLFNSVSTLLLHHDFVRVVALDFSKAFDTVRHINVTQTLANVELMDEPYNWMCEFLTGRQHCTRFRDSVSSFAGINASVVQGSVTGPLNFILNMTNMKPKYPQTNSLSKYADDCHLIVPASASHTVSDEISHIELWAGENNLKLNKDKCKEIIFTRQKFDRSRLPPPLPDVERERTLCVLGVTATDTLTFAPHVNKLTARGHQILYGLKLLKSHGMQIKQLSKVTETLLATTITYASPAWWGFLKATEHEQINAIFRKARKWGFTQNEIPTFQTLCKQMDNNLFRSILADPHHSLQHLLPPVKTTGYNLRTRTHNRTLPSEDSNLLRKNFIHRMIFNTSTG